MRVTTQAHITVQLRCVWHRMCANKHLEWCSCAHSHTYTHMGAAHEHAQHVHRYMSVNKDMLRISIFVHELMNQPSDMCACTLTYMYTYICTCVHVHEYVHVYMYTNMYMCT
eukprot:GHVS01023048.1.p2 GENE.GHVS01023048.1~~GHVS01023048.1.p2  ORF type:complete len:112 (+),score=2.28 GHVS01023048.1:96-431(+)